MTLPDEQLAKHADKVPAYTAAVFEDLPVCDLWDGWQSIANYMVVRGEIPAGRRVAKRMANARRAPEAIAELEQFAPRWPAFRLRKPVRQPVPTNDVALFVYPLNENYGFSIELVALADFICGPGGWRTGTCSAMPVDVLAKMRRGKPLAMIAPARRTDCKRAL